MGQLVWLCVTLRQLLQRRLRVRIRLIRSRDGAVLIDRIIQDHASFSNLAGETIDTARAEAVREIARRIVPQIEPWESRGD